MLSKCVSFLMAAVIAAACANPPPLANASESAEAVAAAVLEALAGEDRAALEALALNEAEFRAHVWPELPSARPERNLPFSYVWGDLRQKSDAHLALTLARHGGRRYTLMSVRYAGETTRYPSYVVHRETVLRVSDDTGAVVDLRLFGSVIQKDDVWKVFSYVVDD